MSDQDMAKLCATTVAEVLKKLSVEGSKMENHASHGIRHMIPMLKKDELDDYLAWSDAMQGLIWQPTVLLQLTRKNARYFECTKES